ncbi:response regulator transcription factor [Enterobacter hormaechei]|nr:response regulator transcription factor [Enterobacter hormaechei]
MNVGIIRSETPRVYGAGGVVREDDSLDSSPFTRPYACVIDPCAFAREGIVSLMAEEGAGEVSLLDSGTAYLQLPLEERLRPVSLLVYRLPTALRPLMEALCFLRRFLTLHLQDAPSERRPQTRVVVLTDLPPFWLYDTLRSPLHPTGALLSVSVLPAHCRPQQLRTVLAGMEAHALLVPLALATPTLRRTRGLNAGVLDVLRSLLVDNLTIAEQARLGRKCVKTLYSQRLSAMRKLGVRTLSGLLRWSVRSRKGQL